MAFTYCFMAGFVTTSSVKAEFVTDSSVKAYKPSSFL